MIRRLARFITRRAAGLLGEVAPDQAQALRAEVEHIPVGLEALAFAAGGLVAAIRMRMTFTAAGVAFVQLALAISAAVYGAYHLVSPLGPTCAKLELMRGEPGVCARVLNTVQLEQLLQTGPLPWMWRLGLLGGAGVLLLVVAVHLALGRVRAVFRATAAAAALGVAAGVLGLAPLATPVTYLAQFGALCLAAMLLHRILHWDAARLREARPA